MSVALWTSGGSRGDTGVPVVRSSCRVPGPDPHRLRLDVYWTGSSREGVCGPKSVGEVPPVSSSQG